MYGQEITPKPGKASDFNAYLDFLAFLFWQASIFHCTPGSTGVRPNTPLVNIWESLTNEFGGERNIGLKG